MEPLLDAATLRRASVFCDLILLPVYWAVGTPSFSEICAPDNRSEYIFNKHGPRRMASFSSYSWFSHSPLEKHSCWLCACTRPLSSYRQAPNGCGDLLCCGNNVCASALSCFGGLSCPRAQSEFIAANKHHGTQGEKARPACFVSQASRARCSILTGTCRGVVA